MAWPPLRIWVSRRAHILGLLRFVMMGMHPHDLTPHSTTTRSSNMAGTGSSSCKPGGATAVMDTIGSMVQA